MYSAARVNQFEIKDKCIEFGINVSRKGTDVKIKLNLKINLQRLEVWKCGSMECGSK